MTRIDRNERTDDSRFTPDTHTSWVARFPNRMAKDFSVVDGDSELTRLPSPCFISPLRKINTGSDKKCYLREIKATRSVDHCIGNTPYRIHPLASKAHIYGRSVLAAFLECQCIIKTRPTYRSL